MELRREIRYVLGIVAILSAIAMLMIPYAAAPGLIYGGTSLVLLSLTGLIIILIMVLVMTKDTTQ